MKCFKMTNCSEQDRAACFVWNSFKSNITEMEDIKCWVLKGAYQEENKLQLQKCHECGYFIELNYNSGIYSELNADTAVIICEGSINNDKTRAIEKIWTTLKQNGKNKIIIDISKVANIYSCGLSLLIKIHKETLASKGLMIIAGAKGIALSILAGTKLTSLLKVAESREVALEFFENQRRRVQQYAQDQQPAAVLSISVPPVKKRVPCWDFWENQNPHNATKCDECFKKITPSKEPCWIVEGMIEGVSFLYVNEECEACDYFITYGKKQVEATE